MPKTTADCVVERFRTIRRPGQTASNAGPGPHGAEYFCFDAVPAGGTLDYEDKFAIEAIAKGGPRGHIMFREIKELEQRASPPSRPTADAYHHAAVDGRMSERQKRLSMVPRQPRPIFI
jgi:hypothetical protein